MTSTERLYTFETGANGPQVVFLPGLGATTRYWQGHLGALEQTHRILLVDPLGFGQSPKPWTRYTVERHIAALYEVLHEHGPFTLVGHSMGTLLALAYAAQYPEQVERLVLLSVPYFGNKEKALDYFGAQSALNRMLLSNIALAAITCIITRRVFGRLLPYLRTDVPREVAADTVKHTWRSFTSSLWEVIYSGNAIQAVEVLGSGIPVFCLHGDQDQVAPLDGVLTLAYKRRNWHVQVLPGVDHHPLFRTLDVCLQAIAATLPQAALPVQQAIWSGDDLAKWPGAKGAAWR
ncbi:MAG: alpha/beta hydrolase [Caldilinea sp. CFX5]|nr:alpha/beta hydrolase [Caldilinea sp. CFX5]